MEKITRAVRDLNIISNWQAGESSESLGDRFYLSAGRINQIVRDWRYNARTGIRPVDVKRSQPLPTLVRIVAVDRQRLAAGKKKLASTR